MKTKRLASWTFGALALGSPLALLIACGNTGDSSANPLVKSVSDLYQALKLLTVSGDDQDMKLKLSDSNDSALAKALFSLASSARVTYALSESATTWAPIFTTYPSPLSVTSLQLALQQGLSLPQSAWATLIRGETKVYVRIEAINSIEANAMGELINSPTALETKLLTPTRRDITSVVSTLQVEGAFDLKGASNNLVLTPRIFEGLELLVRRASDTTFNLLTTALVTSWKNVWNNDINDFTFNSYDVKLRAVNNELLFQNNNVALASSEVTLRDLQVNWTGVTARIIDNDPLTAISVNATGDELQVIQSNIVPNVTYELSFDPVAGALPSGITKMGAVAVKTWYPLAEMKALLSSNKPHRQSGAWNIPKLFARVKANPNYALSTTLSDKALWSATNTVVNRASEVTATYNALLKLQLSGNQFDASLSTSDAVLADSLFANREFLSAVYSTDPSDAVTPTFMPLLPSETAATSDAYRLALQSSIAITHANSLALKKSSNIRIKLVAKPSNDNLVYDYGSDINKEQQISGAQLKTAIDVRDLRLGLVAGDVVKVTGASDAASLSVINANSSVVVKLKLSADSNYVSAQDLSASVTNWWDNDNNRYVAASFYYELTPSAANTFLFDSSDLAEPSKSSFEGSAPLSTSGFTAKVITDDLQLDQFKLQGTTTDGLDLVKTGERSLPRNVKYEFSFNNGGDTLAIANINLPGGITWKTWFSFDEMKQILKANNLYAYHAWKVESITVRAQASEASFKLAQTQTSHDIWSSTTNLFELQTVAPEVGLKRQWVIPSLANLKITEYRDESVPGGYWLSNDYGTGKPTTIDRIIEKLATRLPVGPEIAALNEIVFIKSMGNVSSSYHPREKYITMISTFGSPYYASSSAVTVNVDGTYAFNDYELFTEETSETYFQTLYHEYGHHISFEYIFSDFINDETLPYFPWERRLNGSQGSTLYDLEFFNAFVKALNLDDTSKTNFPTQKNSNGGTATPLSNVYSRSDLFVPLIGLKYDWTGKTANEIITNHFKDLIDYYKSVYTNYLAAIGPSPVAADAVALSPYNEYQILYFFSMEELLPIKLMQATMLFATSKRNFYEDNDGNIKNPDGTKYKMLYDVQSLPFSEGVGKENYAPDYLFNSITNPDGSTSTDASHANALVAALHKRMGYTDRANLSHIWWENKMVNDVQTFEGQEQYALSYAGPQISTEKFSFGGYVANDNYQYVGYYDDNQVFQSVPIFVAPFNLRAKTHISATSYAPADPSQLNFYYFTKKSVDTSWINRPLYFSTDAKGANALALHGYNAKASSDLPGQQFRENNTPNVRSVFARENSAGQVELRIQNNTKTQHDAFPSSS